MKKLLVTLACLMAANLVGATGTDSADPLFAATLQTPEEKTAPLSGFRGKALVVNFWARWCAPCRAEIPELLKFGAAHRGEITVLGIGIENQGKPVLEFARANAMDYPLFIAGDAGIPLMKSLGNTAGVLPFTVFVDRSGRIVQRKLGRVTLEDLEAALPRLTQ